jgi:hypothetical protein
VLGHRHRLRTGEVDQPAETVLRALAVSVFLRLPAMAELATAPAAEATSRRSLKHRRKPQKWRKMAKLNRRRRWRGPALGGRLQRGVRFCFSAHDGEATTPTLTEWARPEIVHAGRRPTATQMVNQARALRSIGAKKVRRAGNGWVWRLSDNGRNSAQHELTLRNR